MAESLTPEGQVATDPAGTTVAAPGGQGEGQSVAPGQTIVNGPVAGGEESFFDPETIKGKPELELAYKQMQSAFTKSRMAHAEGKDKITQYDQFMSDPLTNATKVLQQMGHQVVPIGQDGEEKLPEFKSWGDVRNHIKSETKKEILDDLKPMFGEMRDIKQQNVEAYLDNNHPDWRTYEETMLKNLNDHPTFVSDPSLLYRMSVPEEILEARAHKKALKKIQVDTDGAQIQGHSTTTQQTTSEPKGPRTVNEAAVIAKERLAARGIHPPRDG